MATLYKRGKKWYVYVKLAHGGRRRIATGCTDKKAAELFARRVEQVHANPESATLNSATLEEALLAFYKHKQSQVDFGKRSAATLEMHRKKGGHLLRLMGQNGREYRPFRLAEVSARVVDQFIHQRQEEGASGSTIQKELYTLRGTLKVASRAGLWDGNLTAVMPSESVSDYKPRTRWLRPAEVDLLLQQLTADKAARVAFMVATSANWNESCLARRSHIDQANKAVFIHGTKTKNRSRTVPVRHPLMQKYFDFAVKNAKGEGDQLFKPWSNVRRDLELACKKAKIDHCSTNDLRRTFASWAVNLGVPLDVVARLMGHIDTRMVERVYGRRSSDYVEAQMAASSSRVDLLKKLMDEPVPPTTPETPSPAEMH